MRRASISALGLLAFLATACHNDSSQSPPPSPITLDFPANPGTAHLEIDPSTGALSVVAPWANGPLVRSPQGKSFVAVKLDPDDLPSWHDPETTAESDFVDVRDLQRVDDHTAQGALPGGGTVKIALSGSLIDVTTSGAPVALIELRLASDDGAYVGFGEHMEHVDAKGSIIPLSFRLGQKKSGTNERHVPVPTFVSSKGYGFSIGTIEAGAADVASSDASMVRMVFEDANLHATISVAQSPIDVNAALTLVTGAPRLPPYWAFAPFQWRDAMTADEFVSDITTTRAKKIPGGCIWIDNPWQTSYNDSIFDTTRFPDAKSLVDQAHALGFQTMLWSTPYLELDRGSPANSAQKYFDEAKQKNFLVVDAKGALYDSPVGIAKGAVAMVDLLNPDASAWWSDKLRAATSLGFVGWKLDYAEDLLPEFLGSRLDLVLDGKSAREARALYPLAYHDAYRNAVADASQSFILGRASAIGGQSHVDAIWPGDLDNDFRRATDIEVGGLPASIAAMLTLSASGFPTYAADTGGFREGTPTKESLLRWAEVNAHSMIFQGGGGGTSHNPWNFDDEAVTIWRDVARRHMDLVPYRRNLSLDAAKNGTPTVRALPLQFPSETAAIGAHVDDEYMLGTDLLVAPVIEQGATSREVYVPKGNWVRWSTGEAIVGGAATTMNVALGDIVVLIREGAAIPMLASDVDTLGDATDPTVVTAKMRASVFRAHAVPTTSKSTAKFEDGTSIDVTTTSVSFAPTPSDGTLTITLDFPSGNAPTTWSFEGAAATSAASADVVEACTSACVFIDATTKRTTLHLPKSGTASGS